MTDPYATPASDVSIPVRPTHELELIRVGQKQLLWAILTQIIAGIINGAAPQLAVLVLVMVLVAFVLAIMGLIKLFKGFKTAMWVRVITFVFMIIPLVSLLIMFRLSGRATRELRAAGYHVGLMGAPKR